MSSKRQKIARKWALVQVGARIRRARKDRRAPRWPSMLARLGIRRPLACWTARQEAMLMRGARREYRQLTRDAAALKLGVPRPWALAHTAELKRQREADAARRAQGLAGRYTMRPGAPKGPGREVRADA
jgi:hypothetical protein